MFHSTKLVNKYIPYGIIFDMTLTNGDAIHQYKKILTFKSPGGFMRLRKISQIEETGSHTVVLIPGWCESFTAMRPVALTMAAKGYDVVVLDYQHLDNLNVINSNLNKIPNSIPKNEYAKSLALVGFLTGRKNKDVSIVAHSEGAIIGALAAYIKPEIFKSLILVNPAGFIKEKTFIGLSAKLVYSMYKQDLRNFGRHLQLQLRYFMEVMYVMFKNPVQSFKDGLGMSRFNILNQVSSICDSGVQVDLVFNKVDVLFPLDELLKVSEGLCANSPYVMSGGHNEMYINTDEFIELVDKIIN